MTQTDEKPTTPHQLRRMLPRHYRIIELCLAGFTRKQIAQAMQMSEAGIGLIINAPIFQDELARRREALEKSSTTALAYGPQRAKEILEDAAVEAASKHVELLDADDPAIQQRSAGYILDKIFREDMGERVGGAAQVTVITAERLQLIQNVTRELNDLGELPASGPPAPNPNLGPGGPALEASPDPQSPAGGNGSSSPGAGGSGGR